MEETKDIVLPPVIYGEDAPLPAKDKTKNHSGTGTSSGTYTENQGCEKHSGFRCRN